jgi:protein-arginine deiminase
VLADTELVAFNRQAESRMQDNRQLLVDELGLDGQDLIELPVLFEAHEGGALSLWPNLVNGLHVGSRYLAPKPFGPRLGGVDVLEEAVRQALSGAGVDDVHFLDDFEAYSRAGGEIHCGTNVLRQPSRNKPMQLVRLE